MVWNDRHMRATVDPSDGDDVRLADEPSTDVLPEQGLVFWVPTTESGSAFDHIFRSPADSQAVCANMSAVKLAAGGRVADVPIKRTACLVVGADDVELAEADVVQQVLDCLRRAPRASRLGLQSVIARKRGERPARTASVLVSDPAKSEHRLQRT